MVDIEYSQHLDLGQELKKEKTRDEVGKKQEDLKKEYKSKTKSPKWTKPIKKYQVAIFIVLILFLAIIVRFYASDLNTLDVLAKESQENALLQQITAEINDQYYFYNEEAKQELISDEFLKQSNTKEFEDTVEQYATTLKYSYKDPYGYQYLYGVDPYYYYLAAENKDFDTLFPAIGYYFYKIWSFFDDSITLFGAIFYLPLLFTIILALILYFFVRAFSNDVVAFFAAALFVLHPIFLEYSMLGVSDTNVLNILFLVAGLFVFLRVFDFKDKITLILGLALLVIIIICYKYTWSGYYGLIALILTTLILYAIIYLFHIFTSKLSTAYRLTIFVLLILALFVAMKYGFTAALEYLPGGLKKYLHLTTQTFWPDVYVTTKELAAVGISGLIDMAGGKLLMLISFLSLCWLTWKAWTEKNKWYLLVFVWYVSFFVISMNAIRFYPFFIPVFCITLGYGLYKVLCFALSQAEKFLYIRKFPLKVFASIVLLVALFIPVYLPFASGITNVGKILPVVDDSVYDTAFQINQFSEEDAKINTWWDRGHVFTALAKRDVHLKASPHMPQTYWTAVFLTTSDEKLAGGIMRMLNCGYYEEIFDSISSVKGRIQAISVMKQVLALDREDLPGYLEENDISDDVFDMLYCDQPETYVVVMDDLMSIFHVVQQIALWNPVASELPELMDMPQDEAVQILQQDYNMTEEEAKQVYRDLFAEVKILPIDKEYECTRSQNQMICIIESYKFEIDLETGDASYGSNHPLQFFFVEDGKVYTSSFEENVMPLSLIVYNRADNYHSILVKPDVASSMYIRMLLLEGVGLQHFDQFTNYVLPETKHVVSYRFIPEVEETEDDTEQEEQ